MTDDSLAEQAELAFRASLIFCGVRCALEYVLLPLVGIAVKTAIPLIMAVNILAIVAVIFSLRRFWQIGYEHRWQYLLMSLAVLAVLGLFTVLDIGDFLKA